MQTTINCKGQLLSLEKPIVMGILNATPDSFFPGSRAATENELLKTAEKMLNDGAEILDIGGASSRPGATEVPENEELARVIPGIGTLKKHFPEAIISIDTWRAKVAKEAVESGASMVNDISAGQLDPKLQRTVSKLEAPYVLMHIKGSPETMQQSPDYQDVVREVLDFFIAETAKLRTLGIKDIILDPGFGFGKTVEHNYQLLKNLHVFRFLELPILAGISRKSMICKPLKINPDKALNGTTALHIIALQQGAKILRAHDVREALETIRLWEILENA